MDIYQISLIAVTPICAGIGYLFKYLLDSRSEYVKKINKLKILKIEQNNLIYSFV